MSSEEALTVAGLVGRLEEAFDPAWAEEWDRVGLVCGDPSAGVKGVLVTLDATAEAVDRAAALGANVLVTHHPPFLEAPDTYLPQPGPSGTLVAALAAGVSVTSFHTSLDRAPAGADALSQALGLTIVGPLERSAEPVTVLVTYVPGESAESVRAALASAGAGRLGLYEKCSFESEGTGRFEPAAGAAPVVQAEPAGVSEVRVEMVAPRRMAARALEAARVAHPYEEPVVLALEARRARGAARLGRICSWEDDGGVRELAHRVRERLGVVPRVWGDMERTGERIAVANGSAGSLLGDALDACDVCIAGEVRYHDALDAVARGLTIIEVGHDASEWPLVTVLGNEVRRCVGGGVTVTVEQPQMAWRTVEDADDRG